MKKIILLFMLLCFLPTAVFAKAYFASKEEMISQADIIAIVDITNIKNVEPQKKYGNQEAKATLVQTIKGVVEKDMTFFIPCFFPCAIVAVEKGRHIVFLTRQKKELRGCNWHFSYRPINDGKVEWFKDATPLFEMEQKPLEEVVSEIQNILERENQPLQLTIKSDKEVYEVGEDIKITAYFENQSDDIITAAIGRNHFNYLEVYKDGEKIQMGMLYDIKDTPLGFLQSDYHHIKPNEIKEVTMLAKIEKFSDRKLMGPSINYTGFAIVSKNVVFLFKTPGNFQLRLKYQPKFPSSKNEAIHSAYHKMENVWQDTLTSNTITIEVVEKKEQDSIAKLVAKLSKDYMWQNGIYPIINLPETAKHGDVIAECFKMTGFDQGHVKDYEVIEIRQVKIPGSLPNDYFAALIDTDLGRKIILFQYDNNNNWWTRVYHQSEIVEKE